MNTKLILVVAACLSVALVITLASASGDNQGQGVGELTKQKIEKTKNTTQKIIPCIASTPIITEVNKDKSVTISEKKKADLPEPKKPEVSRSSGVFK